MRNNKAVKTFTLIGFIALLTCFIAYKSGTFDNTSDTGRDNAVSDSATTRYNPAMMSTSKSTIGIEQKMVIPQKSASIGSGGDTLKSDSAKSGLWK